MATSLLLPAMRMRIATCPVLWRIPAARYAAFGGGKMGGKAAIPSKKKELAVEDDPQKLCSRLCGGNILKEGQDPVLKADSEYPDWLWKLRTTKPDPLEPVEDISEMKEVDDITWKRLKRNTMKRTNLMKKVNPKF